MALAGVHVRTAADKLGHSSVKTTLEIYTHVLPEMSDAAVGAVANLLYEKRESPN